jgi:hypothetical protein
MSANPPTRPYDAETVRSKIKEFMGHPNQPLISVGMKGVMIGWLNSVFSSDGKPADDKRHTSLGWLFGEPGQPLKPMSTKQLQNAHWYALDAWIHMVRVESPDSKALWLPCREAMTEVLFVLNAAIRQMQKEENSMLADLGEDEL